MVWVKNSSSVKRLHILEKKSLRLMLFLNRNTHTGSFFKNSKISKLWGKVALEEHCLLPKNLCDWFTLCFESHNITPNGQTKVV